jgi:hypothetical protein
MVSGCYPLDPFYKARPERDALKMLSDVSRIKEKTDVLLGEMQSKLTQARTRIESPPHADQTNEG